MNKNESVESVGVAILGAAHPHANGVNAYARDRSAVKIRWVWDTDTSRGKTLAEACGAEATGNLQRVLEDPNIAAVMVFSETAGHDALIEAALDAGKHLYVDKPLTIDGSNAWKLAARIAQAPTLFSSGFVLRRRAHHQFLREQIRQGAFGHITRIRHTNGNTGALRGAFDNPGQQWFTCPDQAGGGGFLDEGTHSADMVMWLLGGRRPTRVAAAVGNVTGRYPRCDEFGQGLMVFEDGTIGAISGSWVDPAKGVSLEICGTEGCAVVVGDRDLYLTTPHLPGADGQSKWTQLPPGLAHPQAVFLDALVGGPTGDLVCADDAAAAAAVMHAMIEAAATGQWRDVASPRATTLQMQGAML